MEWLVALLLIAGGVVAYRYLVTVEAEIRAEISAAEDDGTTLSTAGSEPEPETRIVNLIKARPGVLQTDIYSEFSEVDRKQIQKVLLELDRSGRISRKKSGATYQLSPLD